MMVQRREYRFKSPKHSIVCKCDPATVVKNPPMPWHAGLLPPISIPFFLIEGVFVWAKPTN